MSLGDRDDVYFVNTTGGGRGVVDAVAARVAELRPALVVIDTLQRCLAVADLNDYAGTTCPPIPKPRVLPSPSCCG